MKKTLQNQLAMFRFCFQAAPRLFGFHLFFCVEIELFIFLEYTVWIGYNLRAAETMAPFSQVFWLTIGIFLLFLLHQLIDSAYFQWASERIKPVLVQKLRGKIYEKACAVELSRYDDVHFYNDFILSANQTDQCVDRFMTDSQNFIRFVVQTLLQIAFLATADKAGLFIALLICAAKYVSSKSYYSLSQKISLEKNPAERERDYQHRVFYLHDYAKELRLHPEMKHILMQDFDHCNQRLQTIQDKYAKRLWLLGFCKDYLFGRNFLPYICYLPLLLRQVILEQTMPVSLFVILLSSTRRIISRSGALVELLPKLSYNSAFLEKIQSFLSYEPQMRDGTQPLNGPFEKLSLSHVSFSYGHGARQILSDISLELSRGQKIALVGYNGAGKTTLAKLIMRLYDPDSGAVLRNGTDIRSFPLADYRQSIGAVFQDYKIYAATIRENVVMDICRMDAQETWEVECALAASRFTLTDHKLKYQIDTPLTAEFEKDGVNLSGGESQKVAIARTLYRSQDLIIMDEPSSALDPSAEYQLNRELLEIAKDKTVIFISHRLSAARDADRIYMLRQGQIAEQGTHEELLAMDGAYSRMWKLQAMGYQQGEAKD